MTPPLTKYPRRTSNGYAMLMALIDVGRPEWRHPNLDATLNDQGKCPHGRPWSDNWSCRGCTDDRVREARDRANDIAIGVSLLEEDRPRNWLREPAPARWRHPSLGVAALRESQPTGTRERIDGTEVIWHHGLPWAHKPSRWERLQARFGRRTRTLTPAEVDPDPCAAGHDEYVGTTGRGFVRTLYCRRNCGWTAIRKG